MRRFASFMLGALLGAIIGSSVALLFAPSSGRSFQHQISESVNKVTDDVRQAAAVRRAELENELNRLRQSKVQLE